MVELFKQFFTSILLLFMLGNVNYKVVQFGRMSLQCGLKLEDLLSVSNSLIRTKFGSYTVTLQIATKNDKQLQ